jgi:hypothetical protein
MPMSKHPVLLLALLFLWFSPAVAGEWGFGVAAHTGAHGELRPCT